MAKWTGFLRPGGFRFNGVHLRLEGDASRWVAANGGAQAMWDAYFAACLVGAAALRASLHVPDLMVILLGEA